MFAVTWARPFKAKLFGSRLLAPPRGGPFPNSSSLSRASAASHPKQELKDRIMVAMDYFNQAPVVHTWVYKLYRAA
jgi:hypothetical protein